MTKKKVKKPKFSPTTGKHSRIAQDPDIVSAQTPSWRLNILSKEGKWGWQHLDWQTIWNDVFPKLKDFESMTWAEIESSGSHFVDVDKLANEAQKCLGKLNLDDIDQIFSLRLTGTKRIWGIRDGHVLKILWFDPDHEICPSHKKHT